eukprot:Skav201914  [mRNA]  locus=scaffold3992:168698:172120:+ [translate_table: standard]
MSCHSICSSREVLWEALPRDSGLRSVASEPALKVPSSHVKPLRLQPVSLTLPASPSPSPAPISELWHGLRALQAQHQQQVDFMEKLQREAQEGHLKLLQVSTRVDQLEMNAQSFPGFIQRELETRLLQEREMQRVDNVLLELQGLRQGATQLQEEVARQGRLAQDLHVAQLHNDTAAELENQRLIERLERLEDGTRNGKTEDLAAT